MPDLPLKGYTSGVIEGIPTFVRTVVGQYIVPKYHLGPPKAQIDDLGAPPSHRSASQIQPKKILGASPTDQSSRGLR